MILRRWTPILWAALLLSSPSTGEAASGMPPGPAGALEIGKPEKAKADSKAAPKKDLPARLERLETDHAQLRSQLETTRRRLDALEGLAQATRCQRLEARAAGRREVLVTLGGVVLRFVEVRPANPVTIGLDPERAAELHREAQSTSNEPLLPWLLRSVPAAEREVAPFLLQDRLIDSSLFARLTQGEPASDTSVEEAELFIAQLNELCRGVATFTLPTEEQLVAAIKAVYDPARNGLVPCAALTEHGGKAQLEQLLGYRWQLTRSLCLPLAPDVVDHCPEGSYVRKGGSSRSKNPLECLPEFRGTAARKVSQQDTSFRLVLDSGLENGE